MPAAPPDTDGTNALADLPSLPRAPGLPLADLKPWTERPQHRAWLWNRADELFETFGRGVINPRGGFFDLDEAGAPIRDERGSGVRGLHATTRMVFCHALGHLLARPGSDHIVDHGLRYLWSAHRDQQHGGYFWQVGDEGPVDDTKQAYGHAFVLLAASAGKTVGHPDADRLYDDVFGLLTDRFWEARHGASAEEFSRDWLPLDTYRGQNSNMHLTEALMAAFEATGDRRCLEMAESIADLIIHRHAAQNRWHLPEHFHEDWTLDRDYAGSEMFRPAGTTPGHWLEWSRLLLQLWQLGGRTHAWMPRAAAALFAAAARDGWDAGHGGFVYTLDWAGQHRVTDKIWWPACEGVGAAVFLEATSGDAAYQGWYRALWSWIDRALLTGEPGHWRPQLDRELAPKSSLFTGRPDLYHALQACLIPLFSATGGLLKVIEEEQRRGLPSAAGEGAP